MKKLGLIIVVVAFIYMGRLSSTSQGKPKDAVVAAPVQIAQATPAHLMPSSSNPTPHAPLGGISINPAVPVPEPASLLLLGSGLMTAGLLGRRLIRS